MHSRDGLKFCIMKTKNVVQLFLVLNIWLCVTSLLMVVATALSLSVPLSTVGPTAVLPALLFYFIYVEDRRRISDEDRINQPYRTQLVRRYRRPLLASELIALAGYQLLLTVAIRSQPEVSALAFLLGQLPFVVLASYDSIKRFPSFDSIAVGGTWAFVTVFSVLLPAGLPLSVEAVTVFLTWVLIVFAGVESRNLQDVEGDAQTDKTTLAAHLGPTATTAMVVVLKAVGVVTFWYLSGPVVAGIVIAYLLTLRAFRVLTRRQLSRGNDRHRAVSAS